jgi:eukaryotic-like serine/threonine-protein kinase
VDDSDLSPSLAKLVLGRRKGGSEPSVEEVMTTLGVEQQQTLVRPDEAERLAREDAELEPGDEDALPDLGHLEALRELGRGGMGRVLEARDPQLRRVVAAKILRTHTEIDAVRLARFVAEAQITSQLEHPGIVPVHEMGFTGDGQLFFTMKKVQGDSLLEVVRKLRRGEREARERWSRHRLLNAFVQVCNAVAYAHDRGVLHRDLKPENIMVGAFGEVLVMDWGVARLIGDTTERLRSETIDRVSVQRTLDGTAIGTPGYMSPEQAMGEVGRLDARADVWSLGAILYELLTWRVAFTGPNVMARLYATLSGPPVDPRKRSPHMGIPDEIADVCMRALASEPDDRYAGAAELGRAVEDYLEGSRRREQARVHLKQVAAARLRFAELTAERRQITERLEQLERTLPPWAPRLEKSELLEARKRLVAIGAERAAAFAELVGGSEKALSQDPGNPTARSELARAYWVRLEEAEVEGDAESRRYYEERVRTWDTGEFTAVLQGTGALTLHTDPPGAEVLCRRYRTDELIWTTERPVTLGRTPLVEVPLGMGSYLLTIRSPGCREVRYPVRIGRGEHWDGGPEPVRLFPQSTVGRGFVYVPAGPFAQGGDPEAQEGLPAERATLPGFFASVFPVTMGDYLRFIDALHRDDPDVAWQRVPRQESGIKGSGSQYWERPADDAKYVVPEVDRDGDPWSARWPVFGVSWADAVAYARWRSEVRGQDCRLPTEAEWEKAARGVDGRAYPWGNDFDPTLCKMRDSRQGRANPEPVGAFPADLSPYGCRDMGGSMRDWCGDEHYDGDADRRPVRGGSWAALPRHCRTGVRGGYPSWFVSADFGFRLVRPLP